MNRPARIPPKQMIAKSAAPRRAAYLLSRRGRRCRWAHHRRPRRATRPPEKAHSPHETLFWSSDYRTPFAGPVEQVVNGFLPTATQATGKRLEGETLVPLRSRSVSGRDDDRRPSIPPADELATPPDGGARSQEALNAKQSACNGEPDSWPAVAGGGVCNGAEPVFLKQAEDRGVAFLKGRRQNPASRSSGSRL